ncbi:hypothetical protein AB0L00_42040 [Actinoallomurus sp. NPDC052308]|uniref:hypothetical protein n=1 Tax=Actinoallomurus sp. NPDC052308 TaxID=3155530 RepID=UPI00341208B7
MNHQKPSGLPQALERKLERFRTLVELASAFEADNNLDEAEKAEELAHQTLTSALPDWAAATAQMFQAQAAEIAKLAKATPDDFRQLDERRLQAIVTLLKTAGTHMEAFRAAADQIIESGR